MRHCLIQRGVLCLTFFCKAMRRVHCPTLRGKAMYPSTLNCIHPSSVFHSKVILLKGIDNCSAAWCKGLRASFCVLRRKSWELSHVIFLELIKK